MAVGSESTAGASAREKLGAFGHGLRHGFGYSPLVIALAAFMLLLMLPPIIFLLNSSLHTIKADGSFDQFTLRFYRELITNPRFFNNFLNTTVYATGSAVVAIILGTIQAWIVERTNTPLRRYVFLVSIISLGIPSVLYTVAFLLLLGKNGPVNEALALVFGPGKAFLDVYTMWGMVIIEGIDFAPLVFLLLVSVFRSADASFEEASMMSGAGITQTFRRITLKLALPGIFALLILIFIRAFESFETPALVGRPGGIFVLTTDIYQAAQQDTPPNYGQAGAFSVALLAVVMVLLYWYNRLSRYAERFQTITGKGYRPRVIDLGKWRYLTAAILVVMFMIIIVLPIGIVVWASVMPYYRPFSFEAMSLFTLENFAEVLDAGVLLESVTNTLILGVATATAVSLFTTVCAWLAVRRYKGGWLLDQLATMPLILPSIVLGVALLQVFLNTPFGLYGTLTSLVLASMIRYLPYGMRYSYAGILQIHTELEEASGMSGGRRIDTFVRVVVPLVAPALITSWLFVFLSSTKAVSLMILLVGPESQVVAVTIFDLWENGALPELAALGVAWTAFMTVIAAIFYYLTRRYGLTVK
ncbi:MAG: iron ABC transporter permease [Alphaproteobacteria bacterium]|nr:iron ABC transporter permease [Alphaproteobacteria bacterium]